MTKKIGMMTFHDSHNNGSMLQALALQHVLSTRYGLNPELIDFSNVGQRNMYAPIPKPKNWKQAIKAMIWATNKSQLKKQFDSFDTFKKKYFRLSPCSYSDSNQLKALESDYDAFLTGSDQVWNIKCTDADDAYYLSFVTNKPRYAYAVSFGANNPFALEGDSQKYESLFDKFNAVSVREGNAQKWIEEATGTKVPVCLDPAMLLDASEWEQLVDTFDKPIVDGKYIFYYCFEIKEEVQKFLKAVAKSLGMPVYFLDAKEWTLKSCWRNGIKLVGEYGPDVYMNMVKHSTLFITSSFHGTAFATIYRKNFWYIRSKHSETSLDDRASYFLTQLGLMDRYQSISELLSRDLMIAPDYSNVDQKLQILRNTSFDYLDAMKNDLDA